MAAKHTVAAITVVLASLLVSRGGIAQPVAQWQTLPTAPYPGKRDDVSFADPQRGGYGTGNGDSYATDDGGRNWSKVASRPGSFIRALGFIDTRTGFTPGKPEIQWETPQAKPQTSTISTW